MVSAFFLMWAWRLMHQNLENRLLDPEPFRSNEHAVPASKGAPFVSSFDFFFGAWGRGTMVQTT